MVVTKSMVQGEGMAKADRIAALKLHNSFLFSIADAQEVSCNCSSAVCPRLLPSWRVADAKVLQHPALRCGVLVEGDDIQADLSNIAGEQSARWPPGGPVRRQRQRCFVCSVHLWCPRTSVCHWDDVPCALVPDMLQGSL